MHYLLVSKHFFNKKECVPNRIQVCTRIKNDIKAIAADQNAQNFPLYLRDVVRLNPAGQKFECRTYGTVSMHRSFRYEALQVVTLPDQVSYSGSYTILSSVRTISDLLHQTNGLKTTAFLQAARFYWRSVLIAVSLKEINEKPSREANLLFRNGGARCTVLWPRVVRIPGCIQSASLENFDPAFGLKDYISQPARYAALVWSTSALVSHLSARNLWAGRFFFFKDYPHFGPAAVITIPFKEKRPDRQTNRVNASL